jgi:hypothetical protein
MLEMNFLYADLTNAADTSADFDMLSNGFKIEQIQDS